jgi:HSP20 family protein
MNMLWYDLDRFGRLLDPWRDFEGMNRFASGHMTAQTVEFPAVNVWVAADLAMVTTELPGIDPKAIDISVVNDTLTLRGSRQPDGNIESESFHRRERWQGQFTKTIELPFHVEVSKIEARYSKGVLSISLPRAEADKPKKIAIKSD